MKKIALIKVIACLLLLVFAAGCAKENASAADEPVAGGYTADREIEPDELQLFEDVMAGLVGVQYEPTLVATQVVAGINYRFSAKAMAVTPEATESLVYVYIYQPLEGEAELTEIVDVE